VAFSLCWPDTRTHHVHGNITLIVAIPLGALRFTRALFRNLHCLATETGALAAVPRPLPPFYLTIGAGGALVGVIRGDLRADIFQANSQYPSNWRVPVAYGLFSLDPAVRWRVDRPQFAVRVPADGAMFRRFFRSTSGSHQQATWHRAPQFL